MQPWYALFCSRILVVECSLEFPERPEPSVRTKTQGRVNRSQRHTRSSWPGWATTKAALPSGNANGIPSLYDAMIYNATTLIPYGVQPKQAPGSKTWRVRFLL